MPDTRHSRLIESHDHLTTWSPSARWASSSVETLRLRDGFDLVLSRIEGDSCPFHFEEPADVFGIGFHLKGGAAFDMGNQGFATRPFDVWAGATPRGSTSTFRLPEHGFHTVSLRFAPDAIRDLLAQHGQGGGLLDEMARIAPSQVSVSRLTPLDAAAARIIDAMFSTPYSGGARILFLESCALGLLAAQIDAASHRAPLPSDIADHQQMHRARAWLDDHLHNPPSIIELARIVGVNDFKLKRSFKAAFGVTIFGYVRQRRMERAAAHLHDGLSVADAADAAGYVCPRCFADAFRRHYGVLPSEVTRAALANAPAHSG
jgi:AraC family transcriptional regulator, transcriptional activator of the genes for pyochelin and ferripyochelin receptors